jgi:predicted  nucleic acid-binding Zn-ribbon protein
MLFKCRDCGKASPDLDMVLNRTCECGGTRFHLISQDAKTIKPVVSDKEQLRTELHRWLDLNMDSIEMKDLPNIRVSFELG